jgi:Fe-Mn family superoxide dismutase
MIAQPSSHLTRRDALKSLGTGAAIVGITAVVGKTAAADGTGSAAGPQPFTLPPLGYAYAALEPHIDARTMEIHHTKHHQAYITNANKALEPQPALRTLSGEEILRDLARAPESIRATLRNNVGGHVNHAFFWNVIAPGGAKAPGGALGAALATLGGLEKFKTDFAAAAMGRFGSGWAWLSVKQGQLVVHSTANQDSPLSEGAVPVLGLDVWEHAYYLHYQNRRADYVAAFWNVLNWTQAGANYQAALSLAAGSRPSGRRE